MFVGLLHLHHHFYQTDADMSTIGHSLYCIQLWLYIWHIIITLHEKRRQDSKLDRSNNSGWPPKKAVCRMSLYPVHPTQLSVPHLCHQYPVDLLTILYRFGPSNMQPNPPRVEGDILPQSQSDSVIWSFLSKALKDNSIMARTAMCPTESCKALNSFNRPAGNIWEACFSPSPFRRLIPVKHFSILWLL